MKVSFVLILVSLAFAGLSSGKDSGSHSKETFGLVKDNEKYHLYCDKKKTPSPEEPQLHPVPCGCFDTPYHIGGNLSDPDPATLNGYIDDSGKRFVLFPNAVVTLRNLEIHVKTLTDTEKHRKDKEQGCVDVKVYRLPKREIQVRETWCPGQFQPVII
ncbi:related to conserved hypothetical Ustilaginaceae-specific protein [Ustilago trichophora]|uniref:Related to conserved hypothetical Ustilaginaceae-specific protein n=1 Tax=Ustilago trichophora TaxID=86804 RepID=A0A5C3DVP3_9BASI|nr:related to conserved hypothetical Ustilaginaceae-specific protein [Ustilago trichophora]